MHEYSFPKWRKQVRDLKIPDLSPNKVKKLKEIYFGTIIRPRKIATEIARVLWNREYISQYLVGPCMTNRRKDRSDQLPQNEEDKLRCKYMRDLRIIFYFMHEFINFIYRLLEGFFFLVS